MERYEKHKDSGIEWIGEIPAHWEVRKLKYVADANPSNIDKKSKDNEEAVLLCNYVDVYKNEYINNDLSFMKATAHEDQIKRFTLEQGDVIATKDSESPGDIAKSALVVQNLDHIVCGYHLTHIKPKEIYGEYLFRYFQTKYLRSYFEVSANGVTRYGLSIDKFNSALILNPPKSEQTTIANYLDHKTTEIDKLISQKEQLLELYEEEKTAIINQAVTKGIDPGVKLKGSGIDWLGDIPEHWDISRLKNICRVRQGLQIPISARVLNKSTNTFPYITIRALNNPEDITEYIEDPSPRVVCKINDILVARTGATGEIITGIEGVFHNNFFLVDYSRIKIDKGFFVNFLKSGRIKEYLLLVAGTTTIPDLNHDDFYNTPFFLFPKEEQAAIAKYIETETIRIDTKISKTNRIISLQKEYRTALISEVVTGKIKVTEEMAS